MFAEETQLERLSKPGDSFEKLKNIDFEAFLLLLENVYKKERKSNVGRPTFDVVMMTKIRYCSDCLTHLTTKRNYLLIADSLCWVIRMPHGIPCWFNLPKPNAAIRGWLTVHFTDMVSPKEMPSDQLLLLL